MKYSEDWRLIQDTGGLYWISNYGRVKRQSKIIERKGYKPFLSRELIMKPTKTGAGYLSVLIKINGKQKGCTIHRLVAEYFIHNPENKPDVNHKFGDKTDNYFKHLEWSTERENINHAFATGLNHYVQKNDKTRSKPVIQLDSSGKVISEFPSIMEVTRTLGFKHPNISNAIKFNKQSHGFYWKFKQNN